VQEVSGILGIEFCNVRFNGCAYGYHVCIFLCCQCSKSIQMWVVFKSIL